MRAAAREVVDLRPPEEDAASELAATRHLGGHWGWMPDFDVAAVQLPSGTWTSPPAKARKRFLNGKEDDLVFYYEALSSGES